MRWEELEPAQSVAPDYGVTQLISCTLVGFHETATDRDLFKYKNVFSNGLESFTDEPLVPGKRYRVTVEEIHE